MSLSRQRALSLICCSLCIVVGCGKSQRPVADAEGVVTFDGKPLAGYMVNFLSEEGGIATGTTDEQGHFTLMTGERTGAPVGECKVYVQAPSNRANITAEEMESATPEDIFAMQHGRRKTQPKPEKKEELNIPTRYFTPEQSLLKFTVAEDEDENVFELKLTK